MTKLTYRDLATNRLTELIKRKESFEVIGLGGKLLETATIVENKIEEAGMSCRIYTGGRIGFAAGLFAGGATAAIGLLSVASIAVHNLVTFGPDYEIEKNLPLNFISVKYKKKK